MGDACHRHPPNNGLGANNVDPGLLQPRWKLALVFAPGGPSLLETYNDERVPVGRQIVERANKSIAEFGAIFEALGLTDPTDAEQMRSDMAARKDDTPQAAAQREQLRRALELQRTTSSTPRRRVQPALHVGSRGARRHRGAGVRARPSSTNHATTWPGADFRTVGSEHGGRKVSTIDLAGKGRFTLLTGIGANVGRGPPRRSRAHGP